MSRFASLGSSSNLQTSILLVATVSLLVYSLFFDYSEEISVEDLIDYDTIAEELESGNPVRIVPYKSPLDERLFIAWPPGVSYNPFAETDSLASFFKRAEKPSVSCSHQIRDPERARKFSLIWRAADRWISKKGLWDPTDLNFKKVIHALRTACPSHVDILDTGEDESGTAEKWIITLEGGQKVVAKLVWEGKGDMKRGALCNDGFEMPTSEIAAFNLHKILGFYNTPVVVGRRFDLMKDILPYASPAVAKQLKVKSTIAGNESCVSGFCYHCTVNHTMCPGENLVEASVALWIHRKLKSHSKPEEYMPFCSSNIAKWGAIGFNNKSYCLNIRETKKPYDNDHMYLDLFDFAVLDMLMYHFDSKHYTVNDDSKAHGLTVRLDHGRAFCAYDKDLEEVFLAPIYQCCTLRQSTYDKLLKLRDGKLSSQMRSSLSSDVIAPVLKQVWFSVLDRRLQIILSVVEKCINANGAENVLVK